MAHDNRRYHPAGYDYSLSDSLQPFPTENTGWGNQAWTGLCVCVIHFVSAWMCA